MNIENYFWVIPLFPLLAFGLIVLFTNRNKALSHWLALSGAGIAWALSMWVFVKAITADHLAEAPFNITFNWLPTGDTWLKLGTLVDPLSAVTLFFVSWTILSIFIYSVGYHNYGQPKGDHDQPGLPPHGATVHKHRVPSVEPMYSRFFALISLFAAAMYLLVLSDNLLMLYVGWEIMGLCSYLLIGFWYGKPSARDAGVKAFLTTRVGDVFMLLGLAALYSITGTLSFRDVLANPAVLETLATSLSPVMGLSWAALIGILLFIGTIGKSAQFPLHIWLPDAMEGPTPVSAMIHAATMVSAGVYLVIRFFPLISAGWEAGGPLTAPMTAMMVIGTFTALFASLIAVTQNDIKRVLAYSTIAQLGYMIAALGIGSFVAATFHLITHAFFKALLFLGSGSVIHGMEHGVLHTNEETDPQNMFNMGGLSKKMPTTFWTFLIGGLALSGFPVLTAGFWSKDEILSGAFGSGYIIVFITLALSALLTAFYTARQITLTFLGEPRTASAEHASENKWTMVAPLIILSFFAISAGWVGIPKGFPVLGGLIPNWFGDFLGSMLAHGEGGQHQAQSYVPLLTSLCVSLGGLLLGWLVYRKSAKGQPDPLAVALPGIHKVLQNKFYVDEVYSLIFIRPAIWIAEKFSYLFLDKKVIDGAIHGIGKGSLWLGNALRSYFDLLVVNNAGDLAGKGTRVTGATLRRIQTGRIQQYMVTAILVLVVAGVAAILILGLV